MQGKRQPLSRVLKGDVMNTIYRYRSEGEDYLVCTGEESAHINSRAARTICSQSFGVSARGILVSKSGSEPVLFAADGSQMSLTERSRSIFDRFLHDTNSAPVFSTKDLGKTSGQISMISKIFVFTDYANGVC